MNCVKCGNQLPWSMGRNTCSNCAPYSKEDLVPKPYHDVKVPFLGAADPQPPPTVGKLEVLGYVVEDLHSRADAGELKYGVRLRTFNGRDALMDAYQEALDLVMYLKQAIMERK